MKAQPLDAIRQEIDAIDDRLLALLNERFAAVARVRAAKGNGPPMRPAREAMILRRLAEAPAKAVPKALRVRLWRAIIAAAALEQANIRIHVPASLTLSPSLRVAIHDHFGDMVLIGQPNETAAFEALVANSGDIAIVELGSPWLEPFLDAMAQDVCVIGCLPFLANAKTPEALVFGHIASEATGADETLVVTNGQLPRDFIPLPLWQSDFRGRKLSSLPGFLDEKSGPLVGVIRSNPKLGLKVLGRYPSPIEARP